MTFQEKQEDFQGEKGRKEEGVSSANLKTTSSDFHCLELTFQICYRVLFCLFFFFGGYLDFIGFDIFAAEPTLLLRRTGMTLRRLRSSASEMLAKPLLAELREPRSLLIYLLFFCLIFVP